MKRQLKVLKIGNQKEPPYQNCKDTLFNNKQICHKMKTIRSVRHQLGSYELNKISLSGFADKRCIHDNGKEVMHMVITNFKTLYVLSYIYISTTT